MAFDRWHTSRTWPGGGWGEALAQVRKGQQLTQKDVADCVGVSLATVRKWEDGVALPDRTLWSRLEEAMGLPVPDTRVPEHTPAERELIDTLLLLIEEIRILREQLKSHLTEERNSVPPAVAAVTNARALDVNQAAEYLGVSPGFIRRLVAERRIVHYKLGSKVRFQTADLDQFIESGKREQYEHTPWQLRDRAGRSPRGPKR